MEIENYMVYGFMIYDVEVLLVLNMSNLGIVGELNNKLT